MKVIEDGHKYRLESIDGDIVQHLIFVSRVGLRYPGNKVKHSGTTSQDVIRCLIDRAKYVNNQIPCWQTALSVWLMRLIIWLYEHRAKKVKGQRMPVWQLRNIEYWNECEKCGHIHCKEHL